MVNKSDFTSSGPRLFLRRGKYEFAFESVNFLLKNQKGGGEGGGRQKAEFCYFCSLECFFLIGTHSMQGWTATKKHEGTKKRSTKRLKHTGNLSRKNLQLIGVC